MTVLMVGGLGGASVETCDGAETILQTLAHLTVTMETISDGHILCFAALCGTISDWSGGSSAVGCGLL